MLSDKDLQKIGSLIDIKLDDKFSPVYKILKTLDRRTKKTNNMLRVDVDYLDRRIIDCEKHLDQLDKPIHN